MNEREWQPTDDLETWPSEQAYREFQAEVAHYQSALRKEYREWAEWRRSLRRDVRTSGE